MSAKRVAVVGVGAIGGALAADLADLKRHSLVLCVRTGFDRLEVKRPGGTSRVAAPVATDPARAEAVDFVLLATKAHQSADALPWLERLCTPETIIAVAQNGVDQVERVAPLVPTGAAIVPVVVQLPAERTAPGRVEQSRDGLLFVPDDSAGRAFAALFDGARTQVRPTADFLSQAWWKLLMNASLGGVCALAIRENGIARDDEVERLVLALMHEALPVARAEGAVLPDDAPEKTLRMVMGAAADHWSSIAVDRREGRPLEWEARNAVVGRLGRRHGIATPLNDAITTLLRLAR